MNLPGSVDDPSLLEHEPLRTHLAMFEALEGQSRLALRELVSHFVDAMKQDDQAVAATRTWAYLIFKDVFSDDNSFALMDGGEQLYKVFFEYQSRLYQALQHGNNRKACEYQARILRRGISAVMLEHRAAHVQHSVEARSGGDGSKVHDCERASCLHKTPDPRKGHRQVDTGIQHLDVGLACTEAASPGPTGSTGDAAMTSSLECGSRSAMDGSASDASPATGTQQSTLPKTAKLVKRSTSKKEKKRKASSQRPPVIAHSDASDDEEPSRTHVVTVASSISHRSKRIASNPCRQSLDLLEVENQVEKRNSSHEPKTDNRNHGGTAVSQPQLSLTNFPSNGFVSPPRIKGRRGARPPFNGHRRDKTRVLNSSTQIAQAGPSDGKLRKMKSAGEPRPRAAKRLRRASIPTLSSQPGEGFKSTCHLQAKEPAIQEPLVTSPPMARGYSHTESKARKKRTRLETETGIMESCEKASADFHESLGPDNRLLRPLPQKVRKGNSVPVLDEDTGIRGVPCGASTLEHADQLLRDVASNALALLREVGPDIPDWTQDEDHDSECDDLSGDDQDEAHDARVTTATSAPSVITHKPPLPAPPRIWAQSRQEVCESFEYFRSYHSGVYSKGDIVRGYLLGAHAASRDVFRHGGKLIISHGGGKSESTLDSRRGPKRFQTDQDQEASDKSVRALLKTYRDRRPIALLADDKYALFPYDLTSANCTYVVLGFYWISHAWAECQPARDGSGRIVRWKFVFQWCEGQGDPWWMPQEPTDVTSVPPEPTSNSGMCLKEDSSHPADAGGAPSIRCEHCREQSPFIYTQGWMCLNPRCNVFWSINGEEPKQLDYREEFLSLLPRKFERLPDLTPPRLVETPSGVTTTYAFSKGWHCAECGRLSCRYKWECWECANCQSKYEVKGRLRSPKEFWHQRPPKGFLHSQIGKDSGILASRLEPIDLGTHKGFTNRLTFVLPHDRGKIHLILGTPLSNGDANDIFRLYQQQASVGELKLRRYPLRTHRARGLLLTNYFSQNSGEPYQYVGGSGHTTPFCEAPDCVRRALALIKERSTLALHADTSFNEILSAAYMERQKMSFHSDSEKGLGPIVASLSLGSAALMHFRLHVGVDDPKSKNAYGLTLVLRHGDVLIMEGDGVQKYYEHTVVPMNFRIAATARCIGSA